MSVTREDVLHVARLARLYLTDEEVAVFTEQVNGILEHVAELGRIDVSSATAVGDAAEWPAPLRDDVTGADALAVPPTHLSRFHEAGFFTVPRLAALDNTESA